MLKRLHRDGKLVARDLAEELGCRRTVSAGICGSLQLPGCASESTALISHPSVDVFILGGRLFKHSAAACGAAAAEAAHGISADLYLLGTAGIHPKEGLTTSDPDEAAMKRILVSRAAGTYFRASIEKLGTVSSSTIVGLTEIAGVISDAPAGRATIQELRQREVSVIEA